MSDPFIGEIKVISFNFPPKGWAFCNGQLLPINQNQALFSILGTTYGGNGQTTFGLPNLQGRIPTHVGNPGGGSSIVLGQLGGESAHTVNISEMPGHTHALAGANVTASTDVNNPTLGNTPSSSVIPAQGIAAQQNSQTTPVTLYGSGSPAGVMGAQGLTNTGGSQPHNNMSPYLVLNFIVAL